MIILHPELSMVGSLFARLKFSLGPNEEAAREAATVLGPSLPLGPTGVVVI